MKKMCKLIALILVVSLAAVGLFACSDPAPPTPTPPQGTPPTGNQPTPTPPAGTPDGLIEAKTVFQIGIIQLMEHPALDAARDGFIDALNSAGILFEYDYQNAQGSRDVLATIAQRFVRNNVDLILAIATPSVQAMAAETYTIPIVGTAITSYERAGVVYSNEAPGGNVTGASDMNPIEDQINMIFDFVPDLQTLGIVYSSSEANSVYQAEIARGIAQALGLTVVESAVTATGEVQQNTLSVANRVDAIFIPTDNTHADAMGVIGQVSIDTGTPVFPGEEHMVMGGGVATYSVSYFELGQQSGHMAIDILVNGADPATMPIQFARHITPIVNGFMLEELGLTVPPQYANYVEHP